MALDGGSADKQIGHDNSASKVHLDDKIKFADRQGDYILIPKDREFAFVNDFSAIHPKEAPFFVCGCIPEVRVDGIAPEPWDASGTMASFSAGSEVAGLRDYKREKGLRRRGPDGVADTEDLEVGDNLPPPAPPASAGLRDLELQKVGWSAYRASLLAVRNATQTIKRWGSGEKGRGQWKPAPVSQTTILVEGEELAEILDSGSAGMKHSDAKSGRSAEESAPLGGTACEKEKLLVRYDLRRFTINSHPALARAMAKLLKEGKKEEAMKMMEESLPRIIREFERVTGRRVIGASIHWDADLPHWNLWHTGLERVIFKKEGGKGKDRMRYRRTAMNLGSSGPGLRAWRRTQLAFERLGKSFCPYTAEQLLKEEKKKLELQGRMPGDWTINAAADAALEELLVDGGFKKQVAEGFEEFVANEEDRYGAGMAGRLAREDRAGLAQEIRNLQELANERGDELAKLKAGAGIAGQQARANSEGFAKQIQNHQKLVDERGGELAELKAAAGVAGRLARVDREELAKKIQSLQELVDARGVELAKLKADAGIADQQARANSDDLGKQNQSLRELADLREAELSVFKSAAPVNRRIRKLVTAFLAMVAEKPDVMAMLKRVPVLRELFSSLASLIGVKLDFGPVAEADALVPVTVELDKAKSSPEIARNVKKSALVHPALVVDPGIGN